MLDLVHEAPPLPLPNLQAIAREPSCRLDLPEAVKNLLLTHYPQDGAERIAADEVLTSIQLADASGQYELNLQDSDPATLANAPSELLGLLKDMRFSLLVLPLGMSDIAVGRWAGSLPNLAYLHAEQVTRQSTSTIDLGAVAPNLRSVRLSGEIGQLAVPPHVRSGARLPSPEEQIAQTQWLRANSHRLRVTEVGDLLVKYHQLPEISSREQMDQFIHLKISQLNDKPGEGYKYRLFMAGQTHYTQSALAQTLSLVDACKQNDIKHVYLEVSREYWAQIKEIFVKNHPPFRRLDTAKELQAALDYARSEGDTVQKHAIPMLEMVALQKGLTLHHVDPLGISGGSDEEREKRISQNIFNLLRTGAGPGVFIGGLAHIDSAAANLRVRGVDVSGCSMMALPTPDLDDRKNLTIVSLKNLLSLQDRQKKYATQSIIQHFRADTIKHSYVSSPS